MDLIPLDDDTTSSDVPSEAAFTLTGIEVFVGDHEQILEALELNRQLLREPQSGADVNELSLWRPINDLLVQLHTLD